MSHFVAYAPSDKDKKGVIMKRQKTRRAAVVILLCLFIVLSIVGIILSPTRSNDESLKEMMRDAVLHETNKVSLFGLCEVNPSVISAMTVTLILLVSALIIRVFVIPRFRTVPGRFQALLESLVSFFDNMASENSPHATGFLSVYIFSAGIYIFSSTIFELFGVQATATNGSIITLSAPISDINGAIAMGCQSYLVILAGGIAHNRLRGVGLTLKEFSLPISMSFRLFGALLSGLLVTELVYYSLYLSIILPVAVAVMFTLLHALIQTYVLTMLTSVFYGEVTEPPKKRRLKVTEKAA